MNDLRQAAQQALEVLGSSLYPQPRHLAAIAALKAALAQVEVERDALRADAERYRWLRKYLSTKDMPILCGRGVRDEPDERDAIDAAIDAAKGGGND